MLLRSLVFALALVLPIFGQELNPKPEISKPESAQTLAVLATADRGVSSLHFDWGEKKPALGVVKGSMSRDSGVWWIVFDEGATVFLPDIKEHPVPGIKRLETIQGEKYVILQVTIDAHLTPVIVLEGSRWQVNFQIQSSPTFHKASILLPQSKEDGLVVSLEEPGKFSGKEVRFIDPHTGFVQVVFPIHQVGYGVDEAQVFPEFRILEAPQGVGFQFFKDDLTLHVTSSHLIITNPNGLAISLPQDRDKIRKPAVLIGLFADAKDLDWVDRRQKINDALMDLTHDQHGPGELEMAWLLLSYGQSNEALGYLTHLARERPSIIDLPLFQMLRGIGNLLLNRLPEAESQLLSSREEPEVDIWLSLIKALQHPQYFATNPTRLTHLRLQFQLAKQMIQSYPKPLRTQMATLILMAGIALQDLETLTTFLDQESRPDNISAGEVYDLARARVLLNQNKPDAALQVLGELMEKASSPIVKAIARFDYVSHRLETKMMRREDAFAQLEALRLQWHGGWFDRKVAAYLATLKSGKS